MEESGREKTARGHCRLLKPTFFLAVFLLVCMGSAHALETDIFVSAYELFTGDTLRVSFTVYESDPSVTILSDSFFPESFTLVSSRKERSHVSRSGVFADNKISATVIDYEWIPTLAGEYILGPFRISSGPDSIALPSIAVNVLASPVEKKAILRWRVSSSPVTAGTPIRIVLEGLFEGSAGTLTCSAPENALLELLGDSGREEDSESGWKNIAAYNWTPLSPGNQSLPRAYLEYATASQATGKLVSEAKTVVVRRAVERSDEPLMTETLEKAFSSVIESRKTESVPEKTLFPPLPPEILALLKPGESEWIPGNYATILALLRSKEYTSLFPAKYRSVREKAETVLGLGETLTVPLSAWKPWSVIGSVVCISLSFCLIFLLTFIPRRRILAYLFLFFSVLLAIFAISLYTRTRLPGGVVKGGNLLHVPEKNSSVIESPKEGSTVRILRSPGNWIYVETDSELHGWMDGTEVLQYTATE